MAEQSPTVSIWAACSIIFDAGTPIFESQDGSWDEPAIRTEGAGIVVLSLLPGRGIDQLACTEAPSGRLAPPPALVRIPAFLIEHIDDIEKRVLIFGAGVPSDQPFTLVLFRNLIRP